MKVKANWPVDTGKKVHQAGAEFDVSKEEAEALEAGGAVEILGRKKADEKPEDSGKKGTDGGGDDDPTPPAA